MDSKKKKLINIPETKGLLHNFKFGMDIPFEPLAHPKTLYYPLDQERHTRPKILNAEVKGICNMFVSCDMGLAIDDLNMRPHIYNVQEFEGKENVMYLHPDDVALINEDIVVSDTEEDEETLKHQQEQRQLEEKIKENQIQFAERQKLQKESEKAKEKEIDFTQNFDQLRIAIQNSFTAARNLSFSNIKHPTDPKRKLVQVINLTPNLSQDKMKLGVLMHKQKVESVNSTLEKGRFCTFFKDLSFQDKNQKLFRLFLEQPKNDQLTKNYKNNFEEDDIEVFNDYKYLFEEDPDVMIDDQEDENEMVNKNQIKLKNKSVFLYTDHTTKLQANDVIVMLDKSNQEVQQTATYQKVEFQYSLDQEKKELAIGSNCREELGRSVKMDIIDEQQIKLMKQIDDEIVEQQFGKDQQKRSIQKERTMMEEEEEEDDDESEINDSISPVHEKLNTSSRKVSMEPIKSYNLREGRKIATNNNGKISVEKTQLPQETHQEDDDHLDDIFDEEKKDLSMNSQVPQTSWQNNDNIEEEDDEEFQFPSAKGKFAPGEINNTVISNPNGNDTKNQNKLKDTRKDDFINDGDEDDSDQSSESVHMKRRQDRKKSDSLSSDNSFPEL